MTVAGAVPASSLGRTLPHEHVLVDFIGAEHVSPDRYERAEVERVVLPYLREAHEQRVSSLVECTPAFLGRDVELLRSVSEASGLAILTNTGLYGAGGDVYLPGRAQQASADELADGWIREAEWGIEGTGIRPGFVKIGVDAGPLSDVHERLVRAAARTHLATGLAIASHTPDGAAAAEQLAVLRDEGVDPAALIWVHAHLEPDAALHEHVARDGGWVEFDGLAPETIEQHVEFLAAMRDAGHLDRVLVSHDAGWYAVGEPGGGAFRPYTTVVDGLVPALRDAGWKDGEVDAVLVDNPGRAFAIGVRRG